MKRLIPGVGLVAYLLAIVTTGLSLLAKFIFSLFKWDFSPWSIWPLGILSFMTLSLTGYNLMAAAEPGNSGRNFLPLHSYRWGKFQGALTCAYGLFILIPSLATSNLSASSLSVLSIVSGIGILTRKRYGFVLFYVSLSSFVLFRSLAIISGAIPHKQFYYLGIAIFFLYWFVPAGFYYPKRLADFR